MESGDPDTDLVKYSNCFHDGVKLQKAGQFSKAVDRFNKAMDAITPNGIMTISEGRHCLTARSECHLALGDYKKAYDDAEQSLEEDPNFIKGLLAKANALYVKGSFEYALVFYHRGHALRPELDEFTLGISKCTEAIDNSVGSAETVQLEKTGDMTLFHTFEEIGVTGKPPPKTKTKQRKVKESQAVKPSERSVKQLLGELYSDRQYLEQLLEDPAFITLQASQKGGTKKKKSDEIGSLVSTGLKYLDGRTEFWRQQKPIYARKKDAEKLTMRGSITTRRGSTSRAETAQTESSKPKREDILSRLELAHTALDDGGFDAACQIADDTLYMLTQTVVPGHRVMEACAHSVLGDGLYGLQRYEEALESYETDLTISSENEHEGGCNRALTNLGRTHSALGNYDVAIKIILKTDSQDTQQKAWKNHELGRCYLAKVTASTDAEAETTNDGGEGPADPWTSALECGEAAYEAAVACSSPYWTLSAATLCAQTQKINPNCSKQESADKAKEWYEKALSVAQDAGNTDAVANIEEGIDEINGSLLELLELEEEAE